VEPVPAASGLGARRSCGIGARGLTGQTYEGHYFWDTEIYVLPFLV
jgi:trehalose/maltose hydrolase-like predicted phosphorylase